MGNGLTGEEAAQLVREARADRNGDLDVSQETELHRFLREELYPAIRRAAKRGKTALKVKICLDGDRFDLLSPKWQGRLQKELLHAGYQTKLEQGETIYTPLEKTLKDLTEVGNISLTVSWGQYISPE